jgi:pimeloyl-ACP methyl ester carboxylesterase
LSTCRWRWALNDSSTRLGSAQPDAPITIDELAADALALVRELGVGSVHVVGQSMGGMLAMRLAAADPAAVRSLTLCSTVGWIDGHTSRGRVCH